MSNTKIKKKSCKLKTGQKINFQKVLNVDKPKRKALIIENVQNCFFLGGSMGFRSNEKDEKDLINKINYLINLEEQNDPQYKKAGLSGKKSKKMLAGLSGESDYSTGSRKKYYYDFIIFSCVANVPDSYKFASHHFLRDPTSYKTYVSPATKMKKIYTLPPPDDKNMKGLDKIILTPDHALTDGSDTKKIGNKNIRGIEIHKDIDINCLYRPFSDIHQSAFINKSFYNNRGFILNKGTQNSLAFSSFKNSNNKNTGLKKFLKCNKVNEITICGIGKENYILDTLKHSQEIKDLDKRFVVLDACKTIGLEIDKKIITKKIKKDINSKDYSDKDNNYYKLLNKLDGEIVTTEALMYLTDTEDIFEKTKPITNIKDSFKGLEGLFSSTKKVEMNNKLFKDKKSSENTGFFS